MQEINIPGINKEALDNLYDGEMDIYTTVLRSFVNNTPDVLRKMRDVSKDNLSDYLINVHGLKSMSAAIGADEISATAKKLEALSKSNDINNVLKENKKLIPETETLVKNIADWLANQ
jgi:HPt (histidine-containing phosphotransfer) domain-containing protein